MVIGVYLIVGNVLQLFIRASSKIMRYTGATEAQAAGAAGALVKRLFVVYYNGKCNEREIDINIFIIHHKAIRNS